MTTITFDLPDAIDIPLPKGSGTIQVETGRVPAHIWATAALTGLRNVRFADQGSGESWTVAERMKRAEALRDLLYSGRWSQKGSGQTKADVDPREAIYKAAATDYCKKRPKAGIRLADRVAAFVAIMLNPLHEHHAVLMANPELSALVRAHTAAAEALRAARGAATPDDDDMPI